jgi:hypothetical protein
MKGTQPNQKPPPASSRSRLILLLNSPATQACIGLASLIAAGLGIYLEHFRASTTGLAPETQSRVFDGRTPPLPEPSPPASVHLPVPSAPEDAGHTDIARPGWPIGSLHGAGTARSESPQIEDLRYRPTSAALRGGAVYLRLVLESRTFTRFALGTLPELRVSSGEVLHADLDGLPLCPKPGEFERAFCPGARISPGEQVVLMLRFPLGTASRQGGQAVITGSILAKAAGDRTETIRLSAEVSIRRI